ncbi:MAG: hypothetical protein AB8G95_13950 [Anaerolineae bacterium]
MSLAGSYVHVVNGFIKSLEYHDRVLKMKTAGVTHKQSLLQLPIAANCMNWNLGHILVYREEYLGVLDGVTEPDKAEFAVYGYGSPLMTDGKGALQMELILKRIFALSPKIKAALKATSAERFAEMHNEERDLTVEDNTRVYLQYHEAFHLGQVEILQELAKAV